MALELSIVSQLYMDLMNQNLHHRSCADVKCDLLTLTNFI
jgi:hypothetical protein